MLQRLERIYLRALARCDPGVIVSADLAAAPARGPVDIFCAGKCAGPMFDAAIAALELRRALVILPAGYPPPRQTAKEIRVLTGGHPQITQDSFIAGRAALDFFATAEHPIAAFLSGGSSASMDVPLAPWFSESDLVSINTALLRKGLPIESMNVVRAHISALKGGRLAAATRMPVVTRIYSDVATGQLATVGSGPTSPDVSSRAEAAALLDTIEDAVARRVAAILRAGEVPETPDLLSNVVARLLADNATLVAAAADEAAIEGWTVTRRVEQLEGDVDDCAERLMNALNGLSSGELLIAGGEPTVQLRGHGTGGRCSELAVRLLLRDGAPFDALLGGSDGLDGNSGAAGVAFSSTVHPDRDELLAAISRSDTFTMMQRIGRAIMIPPTGNNLRDLYLLART